jgi:MoxR-like ATPase
MISSAIAPTAGTVLPVGTSPDLMNEDDLPKGEALAKQLAKLADNIETVIVGKRNVVEACLIGLLAGGHILLEDVPGVGKTMLARSLARTLGVSYKRIQFTPDLLPSDVTGTVVFDPNESRFHFREGPIFAHVVLADEINRASPKTQSALLECMEEAQVTADLMTHKLPEPFFVIATQNPAESEGVYPLPDSQLDRFAMRLAVGYPDPAAELFMLREQRLHHPIENIESITDANQLMAMQAATRRIAVHDNLYAYILRLANASRRHPQLSLGLSPRGAITLARCSQGHAALRGREYVTPDDVKAVAVSVMGHRLITNTDVRVGGYGAERIVEELLNSVSVEGK